MVTVSSTSGVQSAAQAGWQQLKLQQAQRNADRAEQEARSLQAQAAEAQRGADRAQENARTLNVQSDQAQTNVGRARQGLAAIKSLEQTQTRLIGTYEKVAQAQVEQAPARSAPEQPTAPVVNTQGQTTGTVVNTTA